MRRNTYQFGSVQLKKRANGPAVWVFRYYENGIRRSEMIGTIDKYPTKAAAEKAAEHLRVDANDENPAAKGMTFGAVLDRYIKEEIPNLRFSTSVDYKLKIENHIRPKWGNKSIADVKPGPVQVWLNSLALAPKTKGHLLNIMRCVFRAAMLWEFIEVQANPMQIVKIKGVSKRQTKATVLNPEQVRALINAIASEPYKTMALASVCLGLIGSEVAGLQWGDIEGNTIHIQRGVVSGREGETKNEYRDAILPLDDSLLAVLETWREKAKYAKDSDWIFASDYFAGQKPIQPWHAMENHIDAAARRLGFGSIGWKGLRRTYSSLLNAVGVDIKVQQELMRHADIRTTMNLYTDAYAEKKRAAHSEVVTRVIQ